MSPCPWLPSQPFIGADRGTRGVKEPKLRHPMRNALIATHVSDKSLLQAAARGREEEDGEEEIVNNFPMRATPLRIQVTLYLKSA